MLTRLRRFVQQALYKKHPISNSSSISNLALICKTKSVNHWLARWTLFETTVGASPGHIEFLSVNSPGLKQTSSLAQQLRCNYDRR